ncbi:A/G-specific adenine glycosylase [Dysgonomonas sp. 216]|uniref:A/G-specific adenine glycosylase n=1 Tax=Dysgonomonas sp. 216 TaxID=2302934 RepID=UPI0013D641FC|nr:A/G-specific adenine glycosylase [Dysgonomonas sp. 216]NDW18206.1 A/G-specific adenine glycosylase [Dysgonomonas sp. 216]
MKNSIISSNLIKWYNNNKRLLPWREATQPYSIWISEVILQQTRVDQGLGYYNRFIKRFPDIQTLAESSEDEVLKLWQGLGYYSRARNLHYAAKDVMSRFDGIFPKQYKDVLSLKGIGEYTASAIMSISYNQPYAVVDGNVFRVLSRLFAVDTPIDTTKGKKLFSELAQELIDRKDPGTYNQAIMELGALQCVPMNPDCNKCPLAEQCLAFASGNTKAFPVKQGKTKVSNRYFNYFDVSDKQYTYIRQRKGDDIWKNLYELPLIETSTECNIEELLLSNQLIKLLGSSIQLKFVRQIKHVLSHRIIYANFYKAEAPDNSLSENGYTKILLPELQNYAISRLTHKYIEDCK